MNTHKANRVILLGVVAVASIYFFVAVYQREKSRILFEAETAFCEAVHEDLSHRQAQKNISFLSYEANHKDEYKIYFGLIA